MMSPWTGGWKNTSDKGKGKGKKGGKKGQPARKDWVKKVPWADRLSKYYLRPYADRAGSPFVTGSLTEKELLSSCNLSNVMNEDCSEYCRRQGVALSEGAANLQVGTQVLKYHFAGGDLAAGLKGVGIQDFLELMNTPDGQKFQDACGYLNTAGNEVERTEQATATAVKRFMRFLTKDAEKKEVMFKKMLRFAARLHLCASEGLEAVTALGHPKVMAAGVQRVGMEYNLHAATRSWLKKPEDSEMLLWSLVGSFHQEKVDQKKTRAMNAWDEEDAAHSSSQAAGWGDFATTIGHESDDEPRAKGPAPGGKGHKRKVDALASDDEDESKQKELDLESSPEALPEAKIELGDYTTEALTELKKLVQDAAKNPKERPAIGTLQEALKIVPTSALESLGLQSIIQQFLQKTRYPKTANLHNFLETLERLAATLQDAFEQAEK